MAALPLRDRWMKKRWLDVGSITNRSESLNDGAEAGPGREGSVRDAIQQQFGHPDDPKRYNL